MNVNLPPAPPGYNQFNLSQAFDLIRRAFIPVVSQDEAAPRVLLQAPNGTVYEVTVDNTGTLQTAVNTGKTRI
jgi:hypothetical protein